LGCFNQWEEKQMTMMDSKAGALEILTQIQNYCSEKCYNVRIP